jgi:hypothetical protein
MSTGLISESYVDSVLLDGVVPDTTTVDFLLNLSVIAGHPVG